MRSTLVGCAALLGNLVLSTAGASAMPATVNDITLAVPDGYSVENSNGGILAKTPDGEVDVWVQTYVPADRAAVLGERAQYWKDNRVEFKGDSVTTSTAAGDVPVHTTVFKNATWKGDPTVLRYVGIGPIGKKKEMILITYWASPQGDQQYNAEIEKMFGTLQVDTPAQ